MPIAPSSYIATRPDSNDGCTSISEQGTILCGVGTTLIDCELGVMSSISTSDFSDYFLWSRSTSEDKSVSMTFRFNQPARVHRISMWFYNAPSGGIFVPSLTLYSSNDNFTTSSDEINIDTSDSLLPMESRRYRLNVDITDEGLMVQYLRMVMTITEGISVLLSEVLFCGKRS